MARIDPVNADEVEPRIQAVLSAQKAKWGAPLANHLLYAHRPAIFRGVRGMWSGLEASGLLAASLIALLNRRVAAHVGCVF